jgi:hypothetical protein
VDGKVLVIPKTVSQSRGVANRDLATIDAIHPDGRILARLDNDRRFVQSFAYLSGILR